MATTAGTAEQLLSLMGDSSNSPITITADIDFMASGYEEPVDVNNNCEIDLDGHTISNAFFSGSGLFNSKKISNGNLVNIYYNGQSSIILTKVVASVYAAGGLQVGTLEKSALDVTCNPTVLRNINFSGQSKLSNIVIRNGWFNHTGTNYGGFGQYRWTAVVLHQCKIGNTGSTCKIGVSNAKNYLCLKDCTYLSDVEVSINEQSLFCGTATEVHGRDVIVSEEVLRNKAALQEKGFLP